MRVGVGIWILSYGLGLISLAVAATQPAAPADSLQRENPRSAVTAFLEACRRQDYQRAAQYMDLRSLSATRRAEEGPQFAQKLRSILNSDPHFEVAKLSQSDDGGQPGNSQAVVASVTQHGQDFVLDLQHVQTNAGGPQVWLFSAATVAKLSLMTASQSAPWFTRKLPLFLVTVAFLETPLWKWLALAICALLMLSLTRLLDYLLTFLFKLSGSLVHERLLWLDIIVRPTRVIAILAVFRLAMVLIDPAAIARLYLGRGMELILVWSIARSLIKLVEFFMIRAENDLEPAQQFASRSLLRLGRRTINATVIVVATLVVLSNWGYNTTTLIAGLGVGGIAVALAAQQTLSNVFGGISLIGDHPVRIGDFGKFGDLTGTVEDIGMRSTRIRTLNRTLVSVPNSSFAGLNLENYASRDKILFNSTLQIKRSTPDEEVLHFMGALRGALARQKAVELGPAPVRLMGFTAASFNIEIFCYVLTPDIDHFYEIQGELLLIMNEVLSSSKIEVT
jgi:MscS family membrane protein